jgi:hypothetical protein
MSENTITNLDIKRVNKSLEEGDKGFLLSFPKPPPGSVVPKDLYSFNFDIPDKGRLPISPQSAVIFTPHIPSNQEKAFFLGSSLDSNINIGISIKSIHKAETKTLVRLQIKDIFNKILYTDYILVICSPLETVRLSAQLLPRFTNSIDSIGPNGGRVLRINTIENGGINLLSQLFTRMRVTGPGIPSDQIISIASFIDDNRTDIEILPFFETDRDVDNNFIYRGVYSFTNVFSCPSEEDLKEISFNNQFLILEQSNNWSYYFRQNLIAQFVPNTGVSDWENISILLNTKNFEALIKENTASRIPSSVFIDAAGRVINDSICLNSI